MSATDVIAERPLEDVFRRLADNGRDMVYRYRVHPWRRFEYVSPGSEHLIGYTPDELYADPEIHSKIVPDSERARLESLTLDHYRQTYVVHLVRKDGSEIVAAVTSINQCDHSGQVL